MTAKLLTDEQERFLIGLLPCNNNIFLASMLNLQFNLRLTAKQINNWEKSHKRKAKMAEEKRLENATTLIRKIADHYGLNNQKLKLQEELGELITASAKSDADHLVEEMADVSIMIEQVVYLLKKESLFAETREKKIGRQIKRIEEEEK